MSDLYLSPIIAGTMKWGSWGAKYSTREYLDLIKQCIEAGATTFDHADIYGHYTVEEEFGAAIHLEPSLRQHLQLITKCGIKMLSPNRSGYQIKHYDTSKEHIIASAENSLRNLRTDYIDLLLIHRPDPLMDPNEIAEAFIALKSTGKVGHFGVSNFSASQVFMINSFFPIDSVQVEISVMELSAFTNGTLDQCIVNNLLPMAWSPLGGGKLFSSGDERSERILAVTAILCEKYKCTVDQVLLSWLFNHPAEIKPVLGTVKPERIRAAIEATKIRLNREEWFLLWRASTGEEVA